MRVRVESVLWDTDFSILFIGIIRRMIKMLSKAEKDYIIDLL